MPWIGCVCSPTSYNAQLNNLTLEIKIGLFYNVSGEDVPVVVDSDTSIGENPGWHAFGFAELQQFVVAFRV